MHRRDLSVPDHPGSQPAGEGDDPLLPAREPNLIRRMRRIRDSRVQRTSSLPPAIGGLVNEPAYAQLVKDFGHARVVEVLRKQVASERSGGELGEAERVETVGATLRASVAPRLRRVINGSGVILHSNLELELDTGRRGERAALVSGLMTQLFGCDGSFVVNNNAAAILLALTALCKGKEVIVSRGQQVEIGRASCR